MNMGCWEDTCNSSELREECRLNRSQDGANGVRDAQKDQALGAEMTAIAM